MCAFARKDTKEVFAKQISMNAQATHVRTKASAQTERTDSTAAARQDLVEHNVKQISMTAQVVPVRITASVQTD